MAGEGLSRQRLWHLMGRAGEELPATASLFLGHVVSSSTPGWKPFELA